MALVFWGAMITNIVGRDYNIMAGGEENECATKSRF